MPLMHFVVVVPSALSMRGGLTMAAGLGATLGGLALYGLVAASLVLGVAALGFWISRRRVEAYSRNLENMLESRTAELRKREAYYRSLLDNANDIIYTHDLDGNFTSLNKAGEHLTGYSRQETLRMNVGQVVAPDYAGLARSMISKKLEGKKTRTAYELAIVSKDGKRLMVEVSTRLLNEDGKPVGVLGIARDMSERKQLEERLLNFQRMEAMGRLAGGVAHDFNNLLMVIQGYSDILKDAGGAPETLRKCACEIQDASARAAKLTQQLLLFSRKHVHQPAAIDLNSVVMGTESMLRRLIGEDVVLEIDLTPGLFKTKADPLQIEQVILNLAINARDAMPNGGQLAIRTHNEEIEGERPGFQLKVERGAYVALSVQDSGIGISDEVLGQIFEPFFTTKSKDKGTGLGLSTVYGIVQQSRGTIWIDSAPGSGTHFRIYLPQVEDDGMPLGEDRPEPIRGGSETVLVVEDEVEVRHLTVQFLRAAGYNVLSAPEGAAALELVQSHQEKIDLLLTDVVMPGMNGRELSEGFLRLRPDAKVLYMSGYTDDAIVQHGVLEQEASFLQKPFRQAELSRKVRDLLDGNS